MRSNVLRKRICEPRYRRLGLSRQRLYAAVALAATIGGGSAAAQEDERGGEQQGRVAMVASDVKDYVTAPLHAGRPQWVRFGVAIGAIALALEYDDDVLEHFVTVTAAPGTEPETKDGVDAAPAVLALGGTCLSSV